MDARRSQPVWLNLPCAGKDLPTGSVTLYSERLAARGYDKQMPLGKRLYRCATKRTDVISSATVYNRAGAPAPCLC